MDNFIVPKHKFMNIPIKMNKNAKAQHSSELSSFREMLTSKAANPVSFTSIDRMLQILGFIKCIEDGVEKLGTRKSSVSNIGGDTDTGQSTKDGAFGNGYVIQMLWPDEDRTPEQLQEEIQWIIFEGMKYLEENQPVEILAKIEYYLQKAIPE